MGMDCTIVIEMHDEFAWECIGVIQIPRGSEFYAAMREAGCDGFPDDMSRIGRKILEEQEEFGEGWVSYKTYAKLIRKYHNKFYDILKKKHVDKARVIYRFDW